MRKNLISLITQDLILKKYNIGTKQVSQIADKILERFPNEEKVAISFLLFLVKSDNQNLLFFIQTSYFIEGKNKKNCKGALYTKYNNDLKSYRDKGIVERIQKKEVSSGQEISVEEQESSVQEEDTTVEEVQVSVQSEETSVKEQKSDQGSNGATGNFSMHFAYSTI